MAIGQSLKPLKIGIVGAGFSGTALALDLSRQSQIPIEIFLFEKRERFGVGEAYSTPYPFHLLNIRAHDMSAFAEQPDHFVNWLNSNQEASAYLGPGLAVSEQFVPRLLYGHYLQDLLRGVPSDAITRVQAEVVDIIPQQNQACLILRDQQEVKVDKVVLALGHAQSSFPFPVSAAVNCIHAWDYTAPSHIGKQDPVFIIGTGLSMIDVVLTLYHQGHQGKIYALSRHGLLPLPHAENRVPVVDWQDNLEVGLIGLTKKVRQQSQSYINAGNDWRSIINAMRTHIPSLWAKANLLEKKQFMRHLLPYWNIHRHRVNAHLANLLYQLSSQQQLHILAGRVKEVTEGKAIIQLRAAKKTQQINVNWLINCMGPSFLSQTQSPLIHALLRSGLVSLDPLNLGFAMVSPGVLKEKSGRISSMFYSLGPPAKSIYWESNAVPEIRKQSLDLARHLLNMS